MKKQCFAGLGGAGKNSLKPFIEKEKNAEFVVVDNETYDNYHCKWIDSEDKQEIIQYFEKDYNFVFLLGLAYSEKKEKTGVKLMKLIGNLLKNQNRDFTMILGLPFSFEYGIKRKQNLENLRAELEKLATKTIIVESEKLRQKYAHKGFEVLSQFHYITWKESQYSTIRKYYQKLIDWFRKILRVN